MPTPSYELVVQLLMHTGGCSSILECSFRGVLQYVKQCLKDGISEATWNKGERAHLPRDHIRRVCKLSAAEGTLQRIVPIPATAMNGRKTPSQEAKGAEGMSTAAVMELVWAGPGQRSQDQVGIRLERQACE